MGLVHQHRQAGTAMGMDQGHQGREVGREPLVGGIQQHHSHRMMGGGCGQDPLQVSGGERQPESGERIKGEIEEQRLDPAQHTGMQQRTVQVARQQHTGARGCQRQQGSLEQAACAIDPKPATLGPQ